MTGLVMGHPATDGVPPSPLQKETFDSCHTQAPRQRRHGVEARFCGPYAVCTADGQRVGIR
jgi:hypothetical protein